MEQEEEEVEDEETEKQKDFHCSDRKPLPGEKIEHHFAILLVTQKSSPVALSATLAAEHGGQLSGVKI